MSTTNKIVQPFWGSWFYNPLLFLFLALLLVVFVSCNSEDKDYAPEGGKSVWAECGLQHEVKQEVVEKAVVGYKKIKGKKNPEILTIIDFSKPSSQKRLYVCDLKRKKLLYKTYVAHGKNSGGIYARKFSNQEGSNQSSLGFFLTGNVYYGKAGRSLSIIGLEPEINDHAEDRHIVMHPSKYVNYTTIKRKGMLGRSLGCPAVPEKEAQKIINCIKGGSCLFVYANDKQYHRKSSLLCSK